MTSVWPAGIRPLHRELDSVVPATWRATREPERLAGQPYRDGVELPPALDARFRRTPWGDWATPNRLDANDRAWDLLEGREELDLAAVMEEGEVFSPSDPRFTLQGTTVRRRGALRRKLLDDVPLGAQFERYLPVLELQVLGSADPKTDLRSQLTEDVPLVGWVDTLGSAHPPNDRQFVVRLLGDSMDGGKRPLVDGAWLILELTDAVDNGTITAVQLHQQGAYTVVLKRLFDEGDTLRLVSQNPDYNDTELGADSADDIRVVARFVQQLPPPQRTRSADPDRLKTWLSTRLQAPEDPPDATGLPPRLDGLSQLELRDQGLDWVLRLEPLPPFVDEVVAADVPFSADLVRGRVGRLPTSPSTAPYTLSAGPLTPLLEPFEHPGLDPDRATVFRLDSNGRALRKLGPYVRLGERIRLLLPPGMTAPAASRTWSVGTWTACELEAYRGLPSALGLRVSSERVEAHWEGAPQRWHRLPAGGRVPEFGPNQSPVLQVHGVVASRRGELSITTLTEGLDLPAGSRWSISMDGLGVGEHAVEVTPAATVTAPTRRAFMVTGNAPPTWPSAIAIEPSGTADLTDWPLEVRGPALWPVAARWQGSRVVSRRLCVGPDGRLPLTELEIDTKMLRAEPIGLLSLDFGELGVQLLQHRRRERAEDLTSAAAQFTELARDGHTELVEKLAERLLAALGWAIRDGVACRPTLVADQLTHEPVALLRVGAQLDEGLKADATQGCRDQGLKLAFLVAGTTWLRHAPGAMFPAPPVDVSVDPLAFVQSFHWSTR